MWLLLLALVAPSRASEGEGSPYDAVRAVEIRAKDEVVPGRGHLAWVEYPTEFEGTLHLWTRSKLKLVLSVADAEREPLRTGAHKRELGTPFLNVPVLEDGTLWIALLSERPQSVGWVELHLVASPETEATRAAAADLAEAGRAARHLVRSGNEAQARELLEQAFAALEGVEGSRFSPAVSAEMPRLAARAYECGARDVLLAAVEQHRDQVERTHPPGHSKSYRARAAHAMALKVNGDLERARVIEEELVRHYASTRAPADPSLVDARFNLGITLLELGETRAARELLEGVHAVRARDPGLAQAEHLELLRALADARSREGDLRGTREAQEAILEGLAAIEATPPQEVLLARVSLAETLIGLDEVTRAKALLDATVPELEALLPAEHPGLLRSLFGLASLARRTGELRRAESLARRVLAARERMLPDGHPDRLRSVAELGRALHARGRHGEARELQEEVLAALARTRSANDLEHLRARGDLARSLSALGELDAALAVQASLVATYERTLPLEHPVLLDAQVALALTRARMGDLAGAKDLLRRVVEVRSRSLPVNHPDLLASGRTLAAVMAELGEFAGAVDLMRGALAHDEATLPEDHPRLLLARERLAATLAGAGRFDEAVPLQSTVVELRRTAPGRSTAESRASLALLADMLFDSGDAAAAGVVAAELADERRRALGYKHVGTLAAQEAVAVCAARTGDYEQAAAEFARIGRERFATLPRSHPAVITSLANQVRVLLVLDARDELTERADVLVRILREHALRAPLRTFARPAATEEAFRAALDAAVAADAALGGKFRSMLIDVIETWRAVPVERLRLRTLLAQDAELSRRSDRADEALGAIEALLADRQPAELEALEVIETFRARRSTFEEAEGDLLAALEERGEAPVAVQSNALGWLLRPDGAAVGFTTVFVHEAEPEGGTLGAGEEHLVAFAVATGEAPMRVDLGPTRELALLFEAWREALDRPLDAGETEVAESELEVERDPNREELEAGRKLRLALVGPLIDVLPASVERLLVCADELVELIPLDSLPYAGERLGDVYRIERVDSFVGFGVTDLGAPRAPDLAIVGAVDYDAAVPDRALDLTPISAALESPERRLEDSFFEPLPATEDEARAVLALFREAFGRRGDFLSMGGATKPAVVAALDEARHVHFATHTWMARSEGELEADRVHGARSSRSEPWRSTEFSPPDPGPDPLSLTGIVLAGANRGRASSGRVPGILTAGELVLLDLVALETAVLSAHSSDRGQAASSRGARTLRTALHGAGTDVVLLSLWDTAPAAKQKFLRGFYAQLWREGLSPEAALRKAKRRMRLIGHPARTWAGWTLTRSLQ